MRSFESRAVTASQINQRIWQFYKANTRTFPWRETKNPYYIFVSELMLQQTQANRVVDYYRRFIRTFPNVESLATCSQTELLQLWQGLGYNRRALFLKHAAEKIVSDFSGKIPDYFSDLVSLPGVGPNTAGAILAYAFNQKVVFVETNIRKTIIYFFFPEQETVTDTEIRKKVTELLKDQKSAREWYWAVVDYGAMLGRTKTVANSRSRHYVRQTTFEGSFRQIRSSVLRTILNRKETTRDELLATLPYPPKEIHKALKQLITERFVAEDSGKFVISD